MPAKLLKQTSPSHLEQLASLTGLRFLAAIWVVVLHFMNISKTPPLMRNFIGHGYVAVDFFFILSGYILTLNYIGPNGLFRGSRPAFWRARFARLYPIYFAALVLSAGVAFRDLHHGVHFSSPTHLWATGLLAASLQQSWSTATATIWNFPSWSVSVETFFYLLFPAVGAFMARIERRRLVPVALGCFCVGMAGPAVSFFTNPAASYDVSEGDAARLFLMVNPLMRLPEFLLGVLAGRMHQLQIISRRSLAWITPLFLVLGGCILFAPNGAVPRVFISNGLLAPVWVMLILNLSHGRPGWVHNFLSTRWMVTLGEASYGIYVLQVPIAFFVFAVYNGPLPLVVFLAILTGIAVCSFWYFETPLRRSIRGRKGRFDHPLTSAAIKAPLPFNVTS